MISPATASDPTQGQIESRTKVAQDTKESPSLFQSVWHRVPSTILKTERRPTNLLRQSSRTPAWPNPSDSIGASIDTGTKKMGRSKAWFTKGPAQDTFDTKIFPELKHLVENCGLPEGDPLFLRVYMIGPSECRATPIVMICCVNKKIREQAERCVSESGMLKDSGFKLGTSALSLEAKTIPIKCKKDMFLDDQNDDVPADFHVDSTVLGSRIFFQSDDQEKRRAATGGPMIALRGDLYQLTVAHILEREDKASMCQEEVDLDEFNLESDHDESGFEDDSDITSLGSISSGESSDEGDREEEVESFELFDHQAFQKDRYKRNLCRPSYSEKRSLDKCQRLAKQLYPSRHIDTDSVSRMMRPNHALDFLLIPISTTDLSDPSTVRTMNTVDRKMFKSDNEREIHDSVLEIRQAAAIGDLERKVFVLTTGGPISGKLLPGATSYRQPGSTTFQKIYVVLIESQILEGDCGAAVIDASTGSFYGHVILGAPGTSVAYIVSALEVLKEIEAETGIEGSLDMYRFQERVENKPEMPPDNSTSSDLKLVVRGSKGVDNSVARNIVFYPEDLLDKKLPIEITDVNTGDDTYACFRSGLKRVSDVKKHIIRCHTDGKCICPKCTLEWSQRDPWKSFFKDTKCQSTLRPMELNIQEYVGLESRFPRGLNDEQKWRFIWDKRFKSHPVPSSPIEITDDNTSGDVFGGKLESRTLNIDRRHQESSLIWKVLLFVWTFSMHHWKSIQMRLMSVFWSFSFVNWLLLCLWGTNQGIYHTGYGRILPQRTRRLMVRMRVMADKRWGGLPSSYGYYSHAGVQSTDREMSQTYLIWWIPIWYRTSRTDPWQQIWCGRLKGHPRQVVWYCHSKGNLWHVPLNIHVPASMVRGLVQSKLLGGVQEAMDMRLHEGHSGVIQWYFSLCDSPYFTEKIYGLSHKISHPRGHIFLDSEDDILLGGQTTARLYCSLPLCDEGLRCKAHYNSKHIGDSHEEIINQHLLAVGGRLEPIHWRQKTPEWLPNISQVHSSMGVMRILERFNSSGTFWIDEPSQARLSQVFISWCDLDVSLENRPSMIPLQIMLRYFARILLDRGAKMGAEYNVSNFTPLYISASSSHELLFDPGNLLRGDVVLARTFEEIFGRRELFSFNISSSADIESKQLLPSENFLKSPSQLDFINAYLHALHSIASGILHGGAISRQDLPRVVIMLWMMLSQKSSRTREKHHLIGIESPEGIELYAAGLLRETWGLVSK